MREHNGYTTQKKRICYEILVDNDFLFDMIYMYCRGKSIIWRLFFGWRGCLDEDCQIQRFLITGRQNFLDIKLMFENTLTALEMFNK